MKLIQTLDNLLKKCTSIVLVLLFAVMMGLSVTQVLLRYFFNSGLLWGDSAARALVIWVGFLGAVLATEEGKHFHLDVVTRFLRKDYQLWFQSFSNLFASVICFFLGQASVTFLGLDSQSKTFLDIPAAVVEVIVPLGFYMMMIQFALRMMINVIEGFKNFRTIQRGL